MPTLNRIARSDTTCRVLCCLVMGTGAAIVLRGDSTLSKALLIPLAVAVLLAILLNALVQNSQHNNRAQQDPDQQQHSRSTPSRHTLTLNIAMAFLLAMNLSTIF
jgi:membrane-associated phospholipid phosphatase